jgi:hypothetical protein
MIKRYPNTFNGQVMERWGILWRSNNRLDGLREHLVHDGNCEPILEKTRQEARALIKAKYGYIKDRPDLQREPHGWKMPIPIKVIVSIRPAE